MIARRDVFQAIADPTRREIIGILAPQPVNINTIVDRFDSTRQAISLHLKILSECGLVIIKQSGRERLCEVRLEKLSEVQEWVQQYQQMWTARLNALKAFVEKEEATINKRRPKNKTKRITKRKTKK